MAGAAARLRVMTSACGFAPCFLVRHMESVLAHYERLGFEVMPYTHGITWGFIAPAAARA